MAIEAQIIKDLIIEAFPNADIIVDGADGVHMSAIISAHEFAGKSMITQHRMFMLHLKAKWMARTANYTPSR